MQRAAVTATPARVAAAGRRRLPILLDTTSPSRPLPALPSGALSFLSPPTGPHRPPVRPPDLLGEPANTRARPRPLALLLLAVGRPHIMLGQAR